MHGSSSVPQDWLKIINEHGGDIKETYGVPVEQIIEAIKYGVRKVNIDTDLRLASTGAMRRFMAEHPSEFDPRKFFGETVKAMRDVCIDRYNQFGTAGNASKMNPISLEKMSDYYAAK
jgi:fructose-bisphosphate aldolase class II